MPSFIISVVNVVPPVEHEFRIPFQGRTRKNKNDNNIWPNEAVRAIGGRACVRSAREGDIKTCPPHEDSGIAVARSSLQTIDTAVLIAF